MRVAVFPGSFDPITLGHMDIIRRAALLFDHLFVCIVINGVKSSPMFSPEERLEMLRASVQEYSNVTAGLWTGLLTDYAIAHNASYLVRGVRNGTDFDVEYGMASIYRTLSSSIETIFLPAEPQLAHISSTMARDMLRYQQPLEYCLPTAAVSYLKGRNRYG